MEHSTRAHGTLDAIVMIKRETLAVLGRLRRLEEAAARRALLGKRDALGDAESHARRARARLEAEEARLASPPVPPPVERAARLARRDAWAQAARARRDSARQALRDAFAVTLDAELAFDAARRALADAVRAREALEAHERATRAKLERERARRAERQRPGG
jgi:hypothetical protein